MKKIFNLFVILAILKNSVNSHYIPIPYGFYNDDYADRSFGFFNNYPAQARNDTPSSTSSSTQPTTTTTVKPQPTTETILYIPLVETIYQPDFPLIAPYPVFYNAPADVNQFDNYAPYQIINNLPPFVPTGFQSFPVPNPSNPNIISDKILLEPSQPVKPAESNENIDVEITDSDRDLLAVEMKKLIDDFLIKKQQKLYAQLESYTEKDPDNYKIIKPLNTSTAESLSPITFPPIKQTDKPEVAETVYNFGDRINKTLGNQLVSNLSSNRTQTTPEENQFKWTTPETDIDESRKLDFGEGETSSIKEYEESTTDISTNKLFPIFPKDLIKRLGNNLTSANDSKRDDFKGEFVKRPKIRHFVDDKGRKCNEELVKHEEYEYYLITCEEKSFDGAPEVRRTTNRSDVTYFTEELTTPIPEIKSEDVNSKEMESNSEKNIQSKDVISTSEIYFKTTIDDTY